MTIISHFTRAWASWSSKNDLRQLDASRLNDLGLDCYDVKRGFKLNRQLRAEYFNARRSERALSNQR